MSTFKICYLSAEVAPFSGNSVLAENSHALPAALKLLEQDIRLMMPKYKSINERKYVLREVIRLREVKVDLGGEVKLANGKTAFLPNSKVHVYFLSIPEYFDRKGVYADPQTGKEYEDNAQRFANFAISVLETLKLLYWQPDIIHCNDWATALIPFYLKERYKDDEFFQNTRTVLTIHDFSQQGIFPLSFSSEIGIGEEFIQSGGACELEGKLNFLKTGILYADAINVTSPEMREKLLSEPEFSQGLYPFLNERAKEVMGILSGLDYETWNPETDQELEANFTAKSLSSRKENKATFCMEQECDPNLPLMVTVAQITHKSQLDTLNKVFGELAKEKIQIVLLTDESSQYFPQIEKLVKKYSKFIHLRPRLDTRHTHLLWGGADFFFLPFLENNDIEPVLIALRYGVVPIVSMQNAIKDILKPFDPETEKGMGFPIPEETPEAMVKQLKKAIATFQNAKLWSKLQKSGMRADYSWVTSAKKYLKLYEKAAKKKR
ncbi:MAG: glycogen synthase [Calditrichaeota bacterium]|nr:MAG: glycogen synthase [Calditrichota bacterium]